MRATQLRRDALSSGTGTRLIIGVEVVVVLVPGVDVKRQATILEAPGRPIIILLRGSLNVRSITSMGPWTHGYGSRAALLAEAASADAFNAAGIKTITNLGATISTQPSSSGRDRSDSDSIVDELTIVAATLAAAVIIIGAVILLVEKMRLRKVGGGENENDRRFCAPPIAFQAWTNAPEQTSYQQTPILFAEGAVDHSTKGASSVTKDTGYEATSSPKHTSWSSVANVKPLPQDTHVVLSGNRSMSNRASRTLKSADACHTNEIPTAQHVTLPHQLTGIDYEYAVEPGALQNSLPQRQGRLEAADLGHTLQIRSELGIDHEPPAPPTIYAGLLQGAWSGEQKV